MKRVKYIAVAAAFMSIILILSACGRQASPAPDQAPASDFTGPTQEVVIKATNWAFEPEAVTVKKGTKVILSFENVEGVHGVAIPEYNVNVKKAGEKVEFIADKTGEFQFICSILCGKGHADMLGKIIVTE